jgi:predicted ester cyclase/ketosteroid isomerase-like protein
MKAATLALASALGLALAAASAGLAVGGDGHKPARAESARNEAAFQRIVDDGLNGRKAAVFDELFAATMVDHDLPPGTPPGPGGSKAKIASFIAAFPDIRFTFESEVASGDKIAGRGYFTGTHKGPFAGIPATGKQVKVRFMDLWRFEDGKVVEYWGQPDVMGLMQQLGAVPSPDRAASPAIMPGHNDAGTAFMKAFGDNDLEAIMKLYASDATYFPTDVLAVKGKKNIRASFAGFLGAFKVEAATSSDVMHITTGDLSISWGKWGGRLTPRKGGRSFAFEGRFTDVSRLVNGQWVYVLDHASLPATK